MAGHNPDRIVLWPGYFDLRKSKSEGRRVSSKSSVPSPTLDNLARVTRGIGLRVKRDSECSHPKRPWAKEGRLWVSKGDIKRILGKDCSKESLIAAIGKAWRTQLMEERREEQNKNAALSSTSHRTKRNQRRSKLRR